MHAFSAIDANSGLYVLLFLNLGLHTKLQVSQHYFLVRGWGNTHTILPKVPSTALGYYETNLCYALLILCMQESPLDEWVLGPLHAFLLGVPLGAGPWSQGLPVPGSPHHHGATLQFLWCTSCHLHGRCQHCHQKGESRCTIYRKYEKALKFSLDLSILQD